MAHTTRQDQSTRRMFRDIACRDVLSEQKLIDLLTLWETRLETAADADFAQKCREMIRLYTIRLSRVEAFKNATSDSTAL